VNERVQPVDHMRAAAQAFDAIRGGGIAIVPNDVGYAAMGHTQAALQRIFDTKGRAPSKLNAMIGHAGMHRRLHRCGTRAQEIVAAITEDYDLPLGVIAPADFRDPLLANLDPRVVESSTRAGTLLMLMNAGRFHRALCDLSGAYDTAIFGSSANLTLQGTHFSVEEIEPQITSIADVIIDYGVLKYAPWKCSSTLLDVETLAVYRRGIAVDSIAWILRRHFAIDLALA
jgi:tRNA A37 threonylcarbamoyladenosine synthetase subunit TsaC/SUA5/YrdC